GAFIPTETLQAVGELARRVGAPVLVDEVYLEMPLPTKASSSFSLGDNFIVTASLTKAYGLSGLRCGWILAAPELARRIWLLNDLFAATPAHPAERMSVVAFDHLEQFRERARTRLAANRPLLETFLDGRDDLECFRPIGGTVVFPKLREADPDAFFQLLRERYETSVVPGKFFEMPRHFRLGIGGETEALRAGLERLGAALDAFA
ncbi:MAG TPA: aminotransferase class I/II-fold pyridoxal phosphate-dependent enzyme, partial [Chthoniobacterales bacterium]